MDQRAVWACLGGLATTAAMALLAAGIATLTGFNIFSFSLWFVVPIGAILCGAAALSGFYFVSHRLHLKPAWWMVIPLIVFAAVGYLSVYYLEYQWLTLDDGRRATDIVTFSQYLDLLLTNQTMHAGRGGQASVPLGDAGYWLAAIEFLGFMIGGAWIYVALRSARACLVCQQYLRKRGERVRYFNTPDQADDYYSGLFDHYVDSDEFARKASLGHSKATTSDGAMRVVTHLLDCEGCHRQLWVDEPSAFNGKEWRELRELNREIVIPPESNVARFVRGSGLPAWLS